MKSISSSAKYSILKALLNVAGFKMNKINVEESFLDYFEDIQDPRIGKNTRYSVAV